MNILKNRHVVIATLMAPVLALLAYFGVGHFVGETPHAAEQGHSYRLVEKPNCRRESGYCGLKNGDFELTLSSQWLDDGRLVLMLKSEHALDGVKLALFEDGNVEKPPVDMRPGDDSGRFWSLELSHANPERDRLRLVASARGALYYGETGMKFLFN